MNSFTKSLNIHIQLLIYSLFKLIVYLKTLFIVMKFLISLLKENGSEEMKYLQSLHFY